MKKKKQKKSKQPHELYLMIDGKKVNATSAELSIDDEELEYPDDWFAANSPFLTKGKIEYTPLPPRFEFEYKDKDIEISIKIH